MPFEVFIAVIAAALLHAAWNASVKGTADKQLGVACVILGHTPIAVAIMPFFPVPALETWPYVVASVVFHFGYQISLSHAYRLGDLTQVYPIARGSAPLIVAIFSVLVLQEQLGQLQLGAIGLIILGILSLALVRFSTGQHNFTAAGVALLTGCFIAGYSLSDGLGARAAGTAFGFYAWATLINAVVFAAYLRITRPGLLTKVTSEQLKLTLIGGTASFIAYALVVWGFTLAPIALVTALRETSIIFALLIGVFFLKEPLNLVKVLATALTLAGSVMLRFAK